MSRERTASSVSGREYMEIVPPLSSVERPKLGTSRTWSKWRWVRSRAWIPSSSSWVREVIKLPASMATTPSRRKHVCLAWSTSMLWAPRTRMFILQPPTPTRTSEPPPAAREFWRPPGHHMDIDRPMGRIHFMASPTGVIESSRIQRNGQGHVLVQ